MPVSYTIDKSRSRILTSVTGSVTVEDILGHFNAVLCDEILPCRELIDTRGVTPPFLSPQQLWRAALAVRFTPIRKQFGPRAIIVNGNQLFDLTQLFVSFLTALYPVKVFRDEKKAEEWLAAWPDAADHTAVQRKEMN